MLNSKAANLYRKQECARQTLCNTDPQRDQPLQTAWKSPVIQILWALTMAQSSMKVRAPALPHCLGYKAWLIQPNLSKILQENKIIAPRPTRILEKRGPLPSYASHVRKWNPKKETLQSRGCYQMIQAEPLSHFRQRSKCSMVPKHLHSAFADCYHWGDHRS